MGKILKTKFKTGFEAVLLGLAIILVMVGIYYFAPGLGASMSKTLAVMELNKDNIDNSTNAAKLPLPSKEVSTKVSSNQLGRIAEYAWNGNSGMIVANGGPKTTSGSLMEQNGVNLSIVRKDMLSDIRNMQLSFLSEFDKGNSFPQSENTAFGISIMGDGGAFYLASTQSAIDEKFGPDKYHVQVVGCYGMSIGEDKLIGPKEWISNPSSMIGKVISAVYGDGDHMLGLNFCFANGLLVNPDPTTYDANAVNFIASENDDYINSAKELIKSRKSGFTVELKEVVDGKLTGKLVKRPVDGCCTWTPGDKLVFDALSDVTTVTSTKDFNNQMATTLIVIKEWAMKNEKYLINLLKATYIGANQFKLYEDWRKHAAECVAKTYNIENGDYWFNMFQGVDGSNSSGPYTLGGTKVMNYADAFQYYGLSDGVNRYKTVYEQTGNYLTQLNIMGFNETFKSGVIPYDDAVNMYFLKSINDIDAGTATKSSYEGTKTNVMASAAWHINFSTGSSDISDVSNKDLQTIYNLLMQAEDSKIEIVGHTDGQGDDASNLVLSKSRANAVETYLTNRGIPSDRFQLVDGRGESEPIGDNNSGDGRFKNRRVEVKLLK
jgi:outer membrane protein OmpA-like peptidoglycan-associated protein